MTLIQIEMMFCLAFPSDE